MTTITQEISEFSPLPDISDPSTFEVRMNALITAMLPLLRTEINAWAGQANTVASEIAAYSAIAQLLVGPGGSVPATRAALQIGVKGYLHGMTMSNNATDATNDIDVAAGECADSTSVALIKTTGSITKRLDAAWSAGTGNGGLDTGSIANGTYHVFAIQKASDGSVDFLFSTSATAPSMPSGYTYFRRIGSFIRSAGAILPFVQDGDRFQLKTPVQDVAATSAGTSAVTRTLTVPSGINVMTQLHVGLNPGASGELVYLSDLAVNDQAPTVSSAPGATLRAAPNASAIVQAEVRSNTSAQIRSRQAIGGASETLYIYTRGWVDSRGRLA